MSHAAPVTFAELEVVETRAETHELTHLVLADAPPEWLSAYRIPGQYVTVKAGEHKPGFFAITSAPGRDRLELLVKSGSPIGDAIKAKTRGERLSVSPPQGKGYPMHEAAGRAVCLVGVGSGIAPLRAVMHSLLANRAAYGAISLIYGARTPAAFPYQAEMDAWNSQGVQVTRVCSRPVEGTWSGPVGRVHDVLLAQSLKVQDDSAVFVCGMKNMVEDVKEAFGKLNLPASRIFLNF